MSRRRFLHPVLWEDEAVAKMTRDERLLFIGMVTIADDEGRLVGSPAHLLGAIYPHDDISPALVRKWRDGVVDKNPNVVVYQSAGRDYIHFKKWGEWQKPSHAARSKLPRPSGKIREEIPEAFAKVSGDVRSRVGVGRDG